MSEQEKVGLAPILDSSTRVLILGSLPGDESLARQEYYASKTNDFWKLVSSALEVDLVSFPYQARLERLKENGIGLWDVFHRGVRQGSADQKIASEVLNDLGQIKLTCPELKLICFNGKKAGESEKLLMSLGYQTAVLPSSSGANRRDQKGRLEAWGRVIGRKLR